MSSSSIPKEKQSSSNSSSVKDLPMWEKSLSLPREMVGMELDGGAGGGQSDV